VRSRRVSRYKPPYRIFIERLYISYYAYYAKSSLFSTLVQKGVAKRTELRVVLRYAPQPTARRLKRKHPCDRQLLRVFTDDARLERDSAEGASM